MRIAIAPRLADWRPRLIAYLGECARRAHEPGVHDCALFLAGGIEAMTGMDVAAQWRGRYDTFAGGLRMLRRAGFEDHLDLVTRRLPSKPVSMAFEGDAAAVDAGDHVALGIVQGASIYVLRPAGLGLVPLSTATMAWGV